MFKKLFGTSSSKPPSTSSIGGQGKADTLGALEKLDETLEMLTKRSSLLSKKIFEQKNKAMELTKAGNKRAALLSLKNKKLYETQLEQIENNILRIHEQKISLENQSTTIQTVTALQASTEASKQAFKDMNIDKVDKVLDDINEQNDQMREINEAIGQPTGLMANMDDDDLMAELEEMEAEQLDSELMEPAVPTQKVESGLPAVPSEKVSAPAKTPEELELEQLQAEMAM
mmetsp:Transcript_712/g.1706  ORF Transcript_712/g.1706 Transcript_712/m.1706 type:complete len:230 (+) Transcript_712:259-948(+)